jgi:hypothetical protein
MELFQRTFGQGSRQQLENGYCTYDLKEPLHLSWPLEWIHNIHILQVIMKPKRNDFVWYITRSLTWNDSLWFLNQHVCFDGPKSTHASGLFVLMYSWRVWCIMDDDVCVSVVRVFNSALFVKKCDCVVFFFSRTGIVPVPLLAWRGPNNNAAWLVFGQRHWEF